MLVTITLERDVARRLKRLKKTRLFKKLLNDVLRAGLDQLELESSTRPAPYCLTAVEGQPLWTDLDNTAEVIAEVDGDGCR